MALYSARAGLFGKRFTLVLAAVVLAVLVGFRLSAARLEQHYISTLAWAVAGKLIVIDPGHGGEDPGAVGAAGVYEKDIVLEVSKKLAEILRQAGAEVLLTRENDRDLSDPGNHSLYQSRVQDLTKRVEIANRGVRISFSASMLTVFRTGGRGAPKPFRNQVPWREKSWRSLFRKS